MRKELIAQKDPKSPISEVFRTLRTNIQFMNTNKKLKTLLVTSTFPGEGKSWVTSNLAVTFAQAGKRVILIDADMRKGRQYAIFGVSPRPGLSNYLSGIDENEEDDADIANYIQKTEVENLYLSIPTITLDLYKTDAKQDDVLKLNSELDNLTKAIKDEKKKDTLSELSKVYEIIRTVSDNCMDTEVEKVCIRVKENVLKAYSLLDTGDWATMAQNVKQGVDEFSKLMTQNKVETERQFAINKAYVMLNELQKAAERQDTEIFLIKYKNLLEDLSNL